ncbi:hypothetical protein FRC19_008539 [Serendipita sp. 401]|nr:hypothetical protein FRC19_008539 [Serendipita sp. 401]KAG9052701.1 hypothetical protein FS842_009387 [Serendipita sp. 407]
MALEPNPFIKTYTNILWTLSSDLEDIPPVQRLHLWARRVNPSIRDYALCPGLHWDHVAGDYPIEGTEFGIVDMEKTSHYYTMALVNNSGVEEIPCPIGIPLPDQDTCCELTCHSLTEHIESIWRDSQVRDALMLPNNRCVKQIPLNSLNFPVFKNELYLRVSRKDGETHTATAARTSTRSSVPISSLEDPGGM